jgi:hypothetical protein
MTEKLDPEAKRLRNISPGDLADTIGALEARIRGGEMLRQKRAVYSATVIPRTCNNSGLSVRCEVPGGVKTMR